MKDSGVLVNFRVSPEEREDMRSEAKKKKFKNLSCFLRFIVRKYYKITEVNEEGLFNG